MTRSSIACAVALHVLFLAACAGEPEAGADAPDASTDEPDASGGGSGEPDAGSPADVGASEQDMGGGVDSGSTDEPEPGRSAGCGEAAPGDVPAQRTYTFSAQAGGERSFHVVVPPGYDHSVPHRVFVGYAGTNWSGEMIRPYLDFEAQGEREIYVYPDLEFRDFPGWGNLGGWLLGPHADPANGVEDIEFTRELLDLIESEYCVDPDRVFATGHSWGGDMAAVVGCFLGDRFRAVAPAAANRPYWFEPADGSDVACVGDAHVWTFFGQNETHFTWQQRPGQFGDEQVAFWADKHGCGEESAPVAGDLGDECVEYSGCSHQTLYCFYGPETGHQIPSYFSAAVSGWFRSFE